MKELFEALAICLEQNKDSVLVTVAASSGSTPRGVGARMLVNKEGHVVGTIGGGAIEYRCQELAQKVLIVKKGALEQFTLAPNEVADLGMVCGGNVQVLFQYISANEETLELCKNILHSISNKLPIWLVAEIGGDAEEGLSVYTQENGWLGNPLPDLQPENFGKSKEKIEVNNKEYYIESLIRKGKVYVFGGGHVSQALVPVLETLDFHCVVYEDRQTFLNRELFPTAAELILGEFSEISDLLTIKNEDYCIVMTRGHQYDFLLQEQLLKTDAHYIGVMGSKRKIAVQIEKLKASGFTDEEIQRITMPIGLGIKAESPAELAISIAGQLIMDRATK